MARAYRMTAGRRAAIKKAQAASARKRRGRRKKKIAIGAGIGALGVVGVTMAAANGYGKRRRALIANAGVLEATMAPPKKEIKYSSSKEIDLIRVTLDEAIQLTPRSKKVKGIDFSKAGKPDRVTMTKLKKQEKENKAKGTQSKGKGKFRVGETGATDKVLRNRPKFNDDRRNGYSGSSRSKKYKEESQRENKPYWLTEAYRVEANARRRARRAAKKAQK